MTVRVLEVTMSNTETTQNLTNSAADGCCEVFVVDVERVQRACSVMPSNEVVDETAALFKLIGHPTRVRILLALAAEELCVCDLAQVLGATVSATSHQLRNMRVMGLVHFRMEGKLAYYKASDPLMVSLLQEGVDHARSRLADSGGGS